MSESIVDLAFNRGHGPWLTPLRGKIPTLDAWQTQPPATVDAVREWLDIGYNLGLRCGARSGLVVIDDDQQRNGSSGYVPPPTGLVSESPTGGRHYYYRAPERCPGNSASKLAPHVDVRGEGGQVVYPGSTHPIERRPYRWVETGEPGVLPAETLAVLMPAEPVRVDMTAPAPVRTGIGYAQTALHREVHRVRMASEGTRNDTLNRSAFSLGQLVAGGELQEDEVRGELTAAAEHAGLRGTEVQATISSGLQAGKQKPRRAPPERPGPGPTTATQAAPAQGPTRTVLVPGSHRLPPDGEYREVGTAAFSEAVLRDLPSEALYRRANVLGEIHDGAFRVVTADRMRTIVDGQVRLGAGKDGGDEEYAVQFRSCSKDLAGVVLSYGETQGSLRDLRHVASHPVCVGPEFELAEPGWNASCGVFQTDATRYEPLPLKTARAVLDDLVVDFPFATAADRANYYGLLLTPILRPAIEEPVPMHLIGSPVERTGKTKLAEIVLGCTVLGHPTPAMQLGMREEEREKRIMAVLLAGQPVIHLDNLHDFVDSPALASLLTSTTYQGRELNHSRMLSVPNGLTVVASGNNVHATGELAKRTVPVILHPPVEAPETRQDYRHPLLRGYVQENRERAVGALLGLLRAWCDAGRPLGSVGFGGFERWAAVVGGIMRVAGYPEWLANLQEWRGGTNDFGDELREMVGFWEAKWGREWVPASALFDLAEERELFGRITAKGSTDRGRRTSFGLKVLNAAENRVVGGWKVEITGRGSQRRARLNRV